MDKYEVAGSLGLDGKVVAVVGGGGATTASAAPRFCSLSSARK